MVNASGSRRICLIALTVGAVLAPDGRVAAQARETFIIRGHAQSLHLYGTRGGRPVIVSSGDGGWMHLAPHVAETLAARGYFVVGLHAKADPGSFPAGT